MQADVEYLHEFLLGALWADDVRIVGDETLADQGGLALGADETVVVPVAVLERDESGATDACKEILYSFMTVKVKLTASNISKYNFERLNSGFLL